MYDPMQLHLTTRKLCEQKEELNFKIFDDPPDNATYSRLHVLTATSSTPRSLTLNQSSAVLMEYR
uniref:Uncharacterized protein n=1 Tax=Glossina palpalis gambiensis TaxID=67801 RepID=A0A1B0B278_9MUSC